MSLFVVHDLGFGEAGHGLSKIGSAFGSATPTPLEHARALRMDGAGPATLRHGTNPRTDTTVTY